MLEHQFAAQHADYHSKWPDADYSVILLDGEPAGRIYIFRGKTEFELMEMTLLPSFQNQGVGTALIRELLEEAQAGGQSVLLYVEHWNPDAKRLYSRLGFHDEEDLQTHWKMRWTPVKDS